MITDANREALPGSDKYRERTIMYLQEFAGVLKEGCAPRRKLHVPGRSLNEPETEPFFEALQLQADCGLRRLHGFSSMRKAAKLGDADEGLDGIQVEGALSHLKHLSLK